MNLTPRQASIVYHLAEVGRHEEDRLAGSVNPAIPRHLNVQEHEVDEALYLVSQISERAEEKPKSSWGERIRAWRLDRAEMALADARHHHGKWVKPFGLASPSERRRWDRKLDRLEERVRKLGGEA